MKGKNAKIILRFIFLFLSLICTAWIFSNSLKNANKSSEQSTQVLLVLEKITGTDISEHFVRKAAHFSEYALQAFLIYNTFYFFCQNKKMSFLCLPFSLATGIIDEWLQSFSVGRSPQFSDVCIDFSGAISGAIVAFLLVFVISTIVSKKRNKYVS